MSLSHRTLRAVPGEGSFDTPCSLSPRTLRGNHVSILHVVCPLVPWERYQRKGLSILHVVCPIILWERYQGKESFSTLRASSPGSLRRVPGKALSVLQDLDNQIGYQISLVPAISNVIKCIQIFIMVRKLVVNYALKGRTFEQSFITLPTHTHRHNGIAFPLPAHARVG